MNLQKSEFYFQDSRLTEGEGKVSGWVTERPPRQIQRPIFTSIKLMQCLAQAPGWCRLLPTVFTACSLPPTELKKQFRERSLAFPLWPGLGNAANPSPAFGQDSCRGLPVHYHHKALIFPWAIEDKLKTKSHFTNFIQLTLSPISTEILNFGVLVRLSPQKHLQCSISSTVFLIILYRCKSQIMKKTDRKKSIHMKYGTEGELYEYSRPLEK